MVDTSNFQEWFVQAKKDLDTAKLLYQHGGYNEIICFHCQQAIEKYIKGLLILVSGFLHEGHNLVKLGKKAAEYESSLEEHLKELAWVNVFYIETRYPAIDPLEVNENDVRESLRIAEQIKELTERIALGKRKLD